MRSLLVIALVLIAIPAQAQEPGSKAALREAKKHYKQGETHYDVGEFDQAIKEYKEAYRLSEAPGLLFNIAQAYRLAGNAEQALHFYKGYLRQVPDAPNRADAEELARQMEARVDADRRRQRELRELAEKRRQAEMSKLGDSGPARDRRNWRLAGLTTVGLGVAALGVGTIVGLSARSDWKEINQLSEDSGSWSPQYQSLYNAAEAKESVATASFVTGIVTIAAGGLLYWYGRGPDYDQPLAVAPGFGSLTVVGSF